MATDLESEKLNRSLMEHMVLGVAHEINNPNTFVRLNAMTLKKMLGMLGPVLDDYESAHPEAKFGPYAMPELRSKMVQLTEAILDASVRIIAVADKLKQCSSFALAKASTISVLDVVQNVINMHRFLLEKWAALEFKYDEGDRYEIDGFALQLEQGFSILLTNACDAVSERYPNPDQKQGVLRVTLENAPGHVAVRFSDNGTGMDAELMEKIFTPYFTTKPQGVGDGLGLPLCKAIVDRHGGRMEVKSEKNVGSTFSVLLPKGRV